MGGFIFLALFGVLVFSGIIPGFRQNGNGGGEVAQLEIWGIFPKNLVENAINKFNEEYRTRFNLTYVAKSSIAKLESDFVSELASGRGPDLLFIPPELLWTQNERIHQIPYTSFPQRDYLDYFADIGDLYLLNDSVLALPLVVDPMVMYYNTDLLRSEGLAEPPKNWTKLIDTAPAFFERDENQNIRRTSIALGEFGNVDHAKDIFAMILLQSNNPIIQWGSGKRPQVMLSDARVGGLESGALVLNFFTQFSDPAKTSYSWNSAMPRSRDFFATGASAFYLGYASEYGLIKAKNPHLKFDVTSVPQRSEVKRLTHGRLYGVAIPISAKDPNTALAGARALTLGANFPPNLVSALGVAPVRSDLLLAPPESDPLAPIFYKAAVMSTTWLDPNPSGTLSIFQNALTAVKTGQSDLRDAVTRATGQLINLVAPK